MICKRREAGRALLLIELLPPLHPHTLFGILHSSLPFWLTDAMFANFRRGRQALKSDEDSPTPRADDYFACTESNFFSYSQVRFLFRLVSEPRKKAFFSTLILCRPLWLRVL